MSQGSEGSACLGTQRESCQEGLSQVEASSAWWTKWVDKAGWSVEADGWMGRAHTSRRNNVNKAERCESLTPLRSYNDSSCLWRQGVTFGGTTETCLLSCAKLQILLSFLEEGKQSLVSGIKKHKQISRLHYDLMFFSFFRILKQTHIPLQTPSRS